MPAVPQSTGKKGGGDWGRNYEFLPPSLSHSLSHSCSLLPALLATLKDLLYSLELLRLHAVRLLRHLGWDHAARVCGHVEGNLRARLRERLSHPPEAVDLPAHVLLRGRTLRVRHRPPSRDEHACLVVEVLQVLRHRGAELRALQPVLRKVVGVDERRAHLRHEVAGCDEHHRRLEARVHGARPVGVLLQLVHLVQQRVVQLRRLRVRDEGRKLLHRHLHHTRHPHEHRRTPPDVRLLVQHALPLRHGDPPFLLREDAQRLCQARVHLALLLRRNGRRRLLLWLRACGRAAGGTAGTAACSGGAGVSTAAAGEAGNEGGGLDDLVQLRVVEHERVVGEHVPEGGEENVAEGRCVAQVGNDRPAGEGLRERPRRVLPLPRQHLCDPVAQVGDHRARVLRDLQLQRHVAVVSHPRERVGVGLHRNGRDRLAVVPVLHPVRQPLQHQREDDEHEDLGQEVLHADVRRDAQHQKRVEGVLPAELLVDPEPGQAQVVRHVRDACDLLRQLAGLKVL
eukprot:Rhum_TRINITY_DN7937_c0_g1::Rhum_TRINITY_DN7937_c0_g1_i1::g.25050::m.25050